MPEGCPKVKSLYLTETGNEKLKEAYTSHVSIREITCNKTGKTQMLLSDASTNNTWENS